MDNYLILRSMTTLIVFVVLGIGQKMLRKYFTSISINVIENRVSDWNVKNLVETNYEDVLISIISR